MSQSSNARRTADLAMPQVRETAKAWLLVPTLYCLISLALLPLGYNFFHYAVETGCVVIGIMALLVANISRRFSSSSLLLIASSGLGWVALLDLLHVMTFEGMGLLTGDTTNLTSQLWIIGRLLPALVLLGAVLFMDSTVRLLPVYLGCALLTAVCLGLLYAGLFPATYIASEGLAAFKINTEYLIIAMLMVAAVQMKRMRGSFTTRKYLGIQFALGAMVLSELCFTQYRTMSDEFN